MTWPRIVGLALLAGAAGALPAPAEPTEPEEPAISHQARPVAAGAACTGAFVSHPLPHTTIVSPQRKPIFAGVGSALGVNDLDDDGDLDLVLANLDGPSSILWNTGGLTFARQTLAAGSARGVNIVDFDGDGWLDLILSHPGSPPSLWLSTDAAGAGAGGGAARAFSRTEGFGAWHVLNAIALADLDRDGDLDLAGASYDAEIAELYDGFAIGGGVAYYENAGGKLRGRELVRHAQALALLLTDFNGDGRLDILVGNDFELPDYLFLWTPAGFRLDDLLPRMPRNTMSLDAADIDNDGRFELFSADMKPYADDAATRAAWQALSGNYDELPADDPQIEENVLLVGSAAEGLENQAVERGVDASGWSWSAKFADLDNDGLQDLYVVNGMYSERSFGHLPGAELIERNQAFRNEGGGRFRRAPEWGLGSAAGGRGMSSADLDGDGDLDVVVNNLRVPAELLENRLCGGASLQVDLRWPASGNTFAVGARLTLRASTGSYVRETRSSSGFLSGDPNRVHFGFPAGAELQRLEITWPDGARSTLPAPAANTLLTIQRAAP